MSLFTVVCFIILYPRTLKGIKMKKILFATDFSSNANKAFGFALNLAEKHQAELIMLHVNNALPGYDQPDIAGPDEMTKQTGKSWENSLEIFFKQSNSDIQPTYIANKNSSVVKGILSVIEKYQPQLVVIGTKGKKPVKELLFGSTTKALIKRSPVPVMAVPEYAELADYNKILYTSDFREFDLKALQDLVELVRPFEPEIKILHMSTDNELKRLEKIEWFKELINDNISYPAISCELVMADDVFNTLNRYMTENDFDMLVMLEKERNGILDKLFHEGLVSKMEFRTWIPLLSYNEHYLRVAAQ